MKIRSVEFGDDEEPLSVTVTMTVDEAAIVYAFAGHVAPSDVSTACGGKRWSEAADEVASCLSGSFFNRFYEGGWRDVLNVGFDKIASVRRERLTLGGNGGHGDGNG